MKWLWQNGCAWPNNFNCFCLFSPSLVGGNQCRKITTRMTRHRSQVCRCSFMTVVMKLLLLLLFLFVFFCFFENSFWTFIAAWPIRSLSTRPCRFDQQTKMLTFIINFQWIKNCWFDWKWKKKNLMADLMSFIVCHFSFSSLLFPTRDSFWWDIITAATNRWIWFANYTQQQQCPKRITHLTLSLFWAVKSYFMTFDGYSSRRWMDGWIASHYMCCVRIFCVWWMGVRIAWVFAAGRPAKKKKKNKIVMTLLIVAVVLTIPFPSLFLLLFFIQ